MPRHPHCRQALLQQTSKPFRYSLLRAYLSPTALDRKEGYLLSTTHSVLAYQVATLGARGGNRTHDLQLMRLTSYLCSTRQYELFLSHFGIIIIPQFCLFVKIRDMQKRKALRCGILLTAIAHYRTRIAAARSGLYTGHRYRRSSGRGSGTRTHKISWSQTKSLTKFGHTPISE